MEDINKFLEVIVGHVWGLPMVYGLVGSGLLMSLLLGGIQFKGFKHAIKVVMGHYDNPNEPGEINHFQALCTALSATVGLGNIAGVAAAIHLGGPGATFWMIVSGILGMALKYAECSLAMIYRKVDSRGVVHGGPMYYMEHGLGKSWKPMAQFFAVAVIFGSYGAANMFQTNQVAVIMNSSFGVPHLASGVLIGLMTAAVIIGGVKRIARVAGYLVPFMAVIYVVGGFVVIFANIDHVPSMLKQIFEGAFSGTAAMGGFTGVAVKEVIIAGIRRAVFSNEAGLGSAPIAHSAAKTNEPVREGVVALLEPFIDTVIICTMTALVVLASGEWTSGKTGVELTALAFDTAIPGFGKYFIPVAVFLFAYSTLISWSYYGERATDYLFGEKGIFYYRVIFCFLAVAGSQWAIMPILNFSDIMLGLMCVPNLIAVWILFPQLKLETNKYFEKLRAGKFPQKR